ncbi:hypothetical protein [Pseudomonas extremaustralis]|uniref:hypothetical protein n=1 Tax=Pseudomonas extremaustralis TaxID=359110 RepID=UPI0023DF751E|nr:hypothetical protein [Pseudomonas extremaustralis]MDF3134506.1 hypothetical protein [Pseudomonas extremaustralis]
MADPYEYSLSQLPVEEILDRQTDEQLVKNYAQTTWNVYEISDDQYAEIYRIVFGTGHAFAKNWVGGRPVTINGETLQWIKRRDSHVRVVTTVHT